MGKYLLNKNNGQEITFVPTAEDVGKKVGKVYDWNGNNLKTWWLWQNLFKTCVFACSESGTSNPTDGLGGGRVKKCLCLARISSEKNVVFELLEL